MVTRQRFQLHMEREAPRGISTSFVNWTKEKALIDLGIDGLKYTWNHGSKIETRSLIDVYATISGEEHFLWQA